MRRRGGFTLIELLVAMAMFIFVIAAASSLFTSVLTQFKQQSRIAETQIEGVIGLELLRRDIRQAGYGLPWIMNGGTYTEAGVDGDTAWVDRDFNDGPPNNRARGTELGDPACNPPGAIRSDKGSSATLDGSTLYDSDVLVLKGVSLARNNASQMWTRLGAGNIIREDAGSGDDFGDFVSSDRIIVISPGSSDASRRGLVLSDPATASSWRTTYNTTSAFAPQPATSLAINIIYGIKQVPVGGGAVSLTDPRMPFNRVEYYVRIPTGAGSMPGQCAAGTGILYRGEVIHSGDSGGLHDELPVMDCVADFQVGYTDNNGQPQDEGYTNTRTAAQIRDDVRMVTVSILAQDGQKDPANCTTANPCVNLAAPNTVLVGPDTTRGRNFNFATYGITDWQNYRWKVYTFTVTMENLG